MNDEIESVLAGAARDLQQGRIPPLLTVRQFIALIGAERRGYEKVNTLRRALAEHGLLTVPDFESAFIDAPMIFILGSEETGITVEAAHPGDDPAYRVSRLEAATAGVESVKPTDPLSTALTKMRVRNFSQLPVMTSERECKGVVTWRSVASRLADGHPAGRVGEFKGDCNYVSLSASLFSVIPEVAKHDFVLVRGPDNRITGIVTASDLSLQFLQLTEPFLLLSEIENHVRRLIGRNFSLDEVRAARDPEGPARPVDSVADLTFGESIRLIENPEAWARLDLTDDRETVIRVLDGVREIRNEVMHFDPDGIVEEQLVKLRDAARYLDDVRVRHLDRERRARDSRTSDAHPAPAPTKRRSRRGKVRKELVYVPSIEEKSFVHLSARGESYALRRFEIGTPQECWVPEGCWQLSEFLDRHPIVHAVDVSRDGRWITGEDEYWATRVAELNREHGLG